ncbi:MAG TPA: hypothetical protein PKM27_13290 [Saprospiraceae bacterium]|nr:hypothetical protein [Saprospiraceae bacterium]
MSKGVLITGCLALAFASMIYYPKWKMGRTEATISWDVSGYYLYLPALFIYQDLRKLEFKAAIDEKYYPSSSPYQSYAHASGNQVMKYTCGLAILYSPFFILAHVVARLTGLSADGYSPIYQFMLSLGSLAYAFLGLWMLRRLLRRYFDEGLTAGSLAILVFATNYFDYASITGAMSHNYLFTLYTALLLLTDQFYRDRKAQWFYLAAGISGLMVLIRPTEGISLLLLMGWGIRSRAGLRERIHFFTGQLRLVIQGALFFLLAPAIQLMYWKYVAGEWLVYSYQDQGFSWFEGHHILQGLFSYRAGWLVYTPVMVLCLTGILANLWLDKPWARIYLFFFLASLYLTFAWNEWTYGGSLGQRALVQHYPVLLFGLASSLEVARKYPWLNRATWLFIGLCMAYNLWLTHQAHRGGIYEAGMMNKAYFWQTLFKFKNDPESKKLLDTNEPLIPFDETKAGLLSDTLYTPDSNYCISASASVLLYQDKAPAGKLKVMTRVFTPQKEWDVWQMAQLIVQYYEGDRSVKTVFIRVNRFIGDGEEKWIDLVTKSPDPASDRLRISLWNPGSRPVCLQAMKLYAAD